MARYRTLSLRDHPLQPDHQWRNIPAHRLVLWNKIGPGNHPCHWCGVVVTWMVGGKTKRGALTVDHLDNDSRNNHPENLVPTCHSCNVSRHAARRIEEGELWTTMTNNRGRHRAILRVCERCGKEFAFLAADKRPNRGRYCSRTCLYNH